jgi:glycosyltransferase involved in cell wall biosynthesis
MITASSTSLGVLVITRNEEANIRRCLDSVAFADQVVVVDSESTDRTAEIARTSGAEVHVRPWPGFAAQKAFALAELRTEWVLWIDADEEVSTALRHDIEAVLHAPSDAAGFRVPRMVRYLGRWIRHGGWYPDPKLRLFRREAGRFDDRLVHEGVEVDGPIRTLDGPLYHYPYRDREHHARKIEQYARLAAEQIERDGRRPTVVDLLLRPPVRFLRMWVLKCGFLDGRPGFVAACMGARYVRLKYRYALERRRPS